MSTNRKPFLFRSTELKPFPTTPTPPPTPVSDTQSPNVSPEIKNKDEKMMRKKK